MLVISTYFIHRNLYRLTMDQVLMYETLVYSMFKTQTPQQDLPERNPEYKRSYAEHRREERMDPLRRIVVDEYEEDQQHITN